MAFHYTYGMRGYSLCAECLAPIDPSAAPLASVCKHRLCNKCWLGLLRKNGENWSNNNCGGEERKQDSRGRQQGRGLNTGGTIAQLQDATNTDNAEAFTSIAKRFNDSAFKPFLRFPNDVHLSKRAEPNLEPRRVIDPEEVSRRIQDIRRVYTKAVSSWERSDLKSPLLEDFFVFCRDTHDDKDHHKTYWLDVYYLRNLIVQGYNQDVTKLFVDSGGIPQPDAEAQESSQSQQEAQDQRANKRAKLDDNGESAGAEGSSTLSDAADRTYAQIKITMKAMAESEEARKHYLWSKSLLRATEALSNDRLSQEVRALYERQVVHYSRLLDEATGGGGEARSSLTPSNATAS
ncbi:hypothetical protein GUITHDRAFT_110626 [Guillardia theta CCMP2712]|uniref:Uncharacterized protein n=2 Tax=Guillardia theta TaxID=55529 RepID=L1J592_GUITC|nr:hypothetical protein GUITHDRAFT_110626 [Guillardia theta CCMP2712]EKX43502.1 hypothetical protein GUITHDRAFT_110626 [Guillardia theta CCMP2712]|eukprot:XP_005830482.1 hypothetical protein GUITHDRAFT_110626 [Guillardia theta CCMP2712]